MRLIGMMDSPYVRRVAVSLRLMGIGFDHDQISVLREFDKFAAINPIVKAPTLITDDGVVLADSTLILQHLELFAEPARRLTPLDPALNARAQRITGLALAACEKTVQLVYEFNLRPEERRHQPWIDRVRGQLQAANRLLEAELAPSGGWLFGERPLQADVSAAVSWAFTQLVMPEEALASEHPRLAELSRRAEALPEFAACPMV
jgi:glutathione S-transferase